MKDALPQIRYIDMPTAYYNYFMEENIYLFIIWHKALWCKTRIINDLRASSFEIINDLTVEWSKEHFANNLKALYGRKLGVPEEKTGPCGKGLFCLLLVKDQKPCFETRKMYDGFETVNSHIYDKKMLYRKWTAGSHRIHCSDTNEETLHDLVVLLGPDYKNLLSSRLKFIKSETKTVVGFSSIDDLLSSLSLFGNNRTIVNEDKLYIFAKCRYDIVSFIGCTRSNDNCYSMNIGNKIYYLYIFGELDGDLPVGSYQDEVFCNAITEVTDRYMLFLKTGKNCPITIENIAKEKKYNLNLQYINTARISKKEPFYNALLKEIKLFICRIKYSI